MHPSFQSISLKRAKSLLLKSVSIGASVLMFALACGSNDASALSSRDTWLSFPYDGKLRSQDLVTKGHDIGALYYDLIALKTPLKKDEFEKTSSFIERSDLKTREKTVQDKYGNNFLYITDSYINREMKYDADKETIIFEDDDLEIRHIFLLGTSISLTLGEFSFGGEKKFRGTKCVLPKTISMTPYDAKIVKDAQLGLAIKFTINYIETEISEKSYFDTKHDGSPSNSKILDIIENSTAYYKRTRKFLKHDYTSVNLYPNWTSADVYLFNKHDGKILAKSVCSI